MSTWRRSATSRTPSYNTVSPEIQTHAVFLALPPQREADHIAHKRVAERRPVAARRRGDLNRRAPRSLQPRDCPRLQPARSAAQPSRPRDGRDNDACRRQQLPPSGIEVVPVVIVAEQYRVNRQELGGGDRRSGQLARARAPAEGVPLSGRIERRVGEQSPGANFDKRSRPADVGDANLAHVRGSLSSRTDLLSSAGRQQDGRGRTFRSASRDADGSRS